MWYNACYTTNICKKSTWVQKDETCIIITSVKQTNDDIFEVMTNKWEMPYFAIYYNAIASLVASDD